MTAQTQTQTRYDELYRPQYHYSPPANWINDPNGLVYYNGEYHLFDQYHPFSTVWGPMHWGHAVSTDLIHWTQLPIALYPDELGLIYSGSAVADANNTSGLLPGGGLVAIFTYHKDNNGERQESQGMAYSSDNGRTWTKYAGNPVIPAGGKDFRDPKVFWHADTGRWVLVLAAGDRLKLYTSPDLIHWTFASDFGVHQGAHTGVWECPDLFPLKIDGQTKWVVLTSLNGAPAGGRGTQYFIGSFDGKTFTNDNSPTLTLWMDYGRDNYAGITYNNTPDGSRIFIGWMNDWTYARNIPTSPWRGAMTIPRQLELKHLAAGIRLIETPIKQLESLRNAGRNWRNQTLTPGGNLLADLSGNTVEIVAEFELKTASIVGFKVRKSADGSQFTTIAYDTRSANLFVDRFNSGNIDFDAAFAGIHQQPLVAGGNRIKIHIFVDWSSVEVFGNDGEAVITDQIFPDASSDRLELFAAGGDATLVSLDVYPLKRIWPD